MQIGRQMVLLFYIVNQYKVITQAVNLYKMHDPPLGRKNCETTYYLFYLKFSISCFQTSKQGDGSPVCPLVCEDR